MSSRPASRARPMIPARSPASTSSGKIVTMSNFTSAPLAVHFQQPGRRIDHHPLRSDIDLADLLRQRYQHLGPLPTNDQSCRFAIAVYRDDAADQLPPSRRHLAPNQLVMVVGADGQ